ncbi:MAG: hypothetical protein Aurels2KO_04480 [Aureliella sp.]
MHLKLNTDKPEQASVAQQVPRAQQLPDQELLELYISVGDREALEAIVRRYSGLVATVCRMTVSDPAAAEDAYQATFLVLVKSASKIRKQASLAAWLHGVAYRTACRIRKKNQAYRHDDTSEPQAGTMEPIETLARQVEVETLNQELERLPHSLRSPLVEHYMLGRTAGSIAESMDVSTSAVEGRLRRGRRLLRRRLASRGISMSIVVAGSNYLQRNVIASDTAAWTNSFVEKSIAEPGVSGDGTSAVVSEKVSSLVKKELSMFGSTSMKIAASTLLVVSSSAVLVNVAQNSLAQKGGNENGSGQVAMQAPGGDEQSQSVAMPAAAAQPAFTGQMGMGGMAGGGEGMGGEMPSKPAAPPEVVTWQRPESDEIGIVPEWLAGGASAQSLVEQSRKSLSNSINVSAKATPLANLASQLAVDAGVAIRINRQELEAFGVDSDTPVSVEGEMPLREAFRIILTPLELTYRATESGIEITSIDDADSRPNIRFYDLAYILPNSANADALVNAIQQSVEPDCWHANGGTSSVVLVGSMMIVSSRDTVHQQIETMLLHIRRMNPSNAATPVGPSSSYGPMYGGGGGMGGFGGGGGGGGMF